MRKVLIYSVLLLVGLAASQITPGLLGAGFGVFREVVGFLTMFCLAVIMIHVGYEFEIDKNNMGQYVWDYIVAGTAAAFPWLFCSVYFVFLLSAPDSWGSVQAWKQSLLAARFAAPTSAGVLFSMLAAAGLAATWVFRKTRVLAIFDDLDTVLLMIPLKMLIVGPRWQLGIIVVIMVALLWLAWKRLHVWRLPVSWPWVFLYAAAISLVCEVIYYSSKLIDDVVPIHLEVLLPAFVLGCVIARPAGQDPHRDDAREGHQEGPEDPIEQLVSTIVSGVFMVLVGLSMPAFASALANTANVGGRGAAGWETVALHVLLVTLISNLGKMFPLLCYRREASWRERLAVCVAMFPRGEVGAGVLVISLSYGIGGLPITVAVLSLALNLVLTGAFIVICRRLIRSAVVSAGTRT